MSMISWTMHRIKVRCIEAKLFFRTLFELSRKLKALYIRTRRDVMIAYALETPQGRSALVEAMVEPIIQSICRENIRGRSQA